MKEAEKALPPGSEPTTGPFLENIDVRVVVFCLRDQRLQVLLTQNCSQPETDGSLDLWELQGYPVPAPVSLEETATESVLHLTGLREAFLEQLYTYGDVARADLPGADRASQKRRVSVVYFAIIPGGAISASKDKDACRAKWFPVDSLPNLAANHLEIVRYALRRLRYKLEYTALGFQLLPEQFSLSELQKTYEMILGEKLDKRNFRRRILQAGIIEETPHLRSGEGRPARLYHYRPDAVAEVKARRLFP
ncbi:MAG TPA: NUDIX domain-containing protein [Anaerolineaceae bacterium]